MKSINRPAQIKTILETMSSDDATEIRVELETYIADLEAKQPNRPDRIAAILEIVGAQYSVDVRATLEDYLSHLETGQQSRDIPVLEKVQKSPVWSHQRSVQRDRRRRERALKKHNNYL